jgi:protein involved in polysaccharide export with SLBB domain
LSGESNPVLRDGDRVYVSYVPGYHALEQASISGEVASPGVYPLRTGQTRLSELVASAGGFLPRADLTTIRVYRNTPTTSETDVEFERLSRLSRSEMTSSEYEVLRTKLAGRREDFRVDWKRLRESPELDLILRDRDIVRVDPLIASVRVEGEVRRPGIVQYDDRRSIHDYVQLAGGYSERAARGKVRITRAVTGQTLRASDVREVAPGDLIWVPERADVSVWQHLATLVGVAAQVATLVIAIRQ